MGKEGHLSDEKAYETDLGKDILTVASEEEKKQSYKELEEALKESEKAKQAAAKAARAEQEKEEAENVESIGVVGWLALGLLVALGVGAFFNFGRAKKSSKNMNRKLSTCEKFMNKFKSS